MKKRGFTLVELLAVIIILGVVALIAIPSVASIIEKSKEGAAKTSTAIYIRAVQTYLSAQDLFDDKVKLEFNKTYMVSRDSSMKVSFMDKVFDKVSADEVSDTIFLNEIIELDGDYPQDGYVTIGESKVENYSLKFEDYVVERVDGTQNVSKVGDEKTTKSVATIDLISDTDGVVNFGDIAKIGTEEFYVISNDGTNVTMLSKMLVEPTTHLQDSSAKQNVKYSSTSTDYSTSHIKKHVDKYVDKLNTEFKAGITESRLLTREEVNSIAGKNSSILEINKTYWIGYTSGNYQFTVDLVSWPYLTYLGVKHSRGTEYTLSMENSVTDKVLFVPEPAVSGGSFIIDDDTPSYTECSDFGSYRCYVDTYSNYTTGSGIRPVIVVPLTKIK